MMRCVIGTAVFLLCCVLTQGGVLKAEQIQTKDIPEGLSVTSDKVRVRFFTKGNHVLYEISRMPDGPNVIKGLGARLMEKNERTDDHYEGFYESSSRKVIRGNGSLTVKVSCKSNQLLLNQKTTVFEGLDIVKIEYDMRRGEESIEAKYNAMPKISFPANFDRCAYLTKSGIKDESVFECSNTDAWKTHHWRVGKWYASYDSKTGDGLLFLCPGLESRKDIAAFAYVEYVKLSYIQMAALKTLYRLPASMMPRRKSYVQFLDVISLSLNPIGENFTPNEGMWELSPVAFPQDLKIGAISYLMPFKGDVELAVKTALEQIEVAGYMALR